MAPILLLTTFQLFIHTVKILFAELKKWKGREEEKDLDELCGTRWGVLSHIFVWSGKGNKIEVAIMTFIRFL